MAADLILITHSHRDHFHIDSLLRLGRDTPIIVPEVDRESALSVDMAYRLKELGFADVRVLGWHGEIRMRDARIVALPWHGEQPTTGAVRNAELRNHGNGYLVEGDGRRFAFIADAGQDRAGDVRQTASECHARYGTIDVLFGGYRAFSLYPLQYVNSSVPHYLLFTPPALLGTRQQIMNDAHALLDTAERWRALCRALCGWRRALVLAIGLGASARRPWALPVVSFRSASAGRARSCRRAVRKREQPGRLARPDAADASGGIARLQRNGTHGRP